MRTSWFGVLALALGCSGASDDGDTQVEPTGSTGGSGTGGSAKVDAAVNGGGGAKADAGTGGGKSDAGSGGNAGSGGAQDAAPHIVTPCNSAAVGVWEEVTPPEVSLDANFNTGAGKNFGTNSFVIDPSNSATLYLGTSAMGIHKTTDCGATWTHVNTGTNGQTMDNGRQWTMVIDPVDPRVIYTVAGYGTNGLFKTTNGGVDWDQILPPDVANVLIYGGFIARIRMDPTDHLHLTVAPHFTCQAGHSENCMIETTDGGTTWTVIENTPPSMEGSGHIMVDRKLWFWAQGFGGLWRTTDGGGSWTNVANSNGYAYDSMYRAPNGEFFIPAAFGVIQSSDGISWTSVQNAPNSNVLTGSPTHIYSSQGGCVGSADQPYEAVSRAPVTDPTAWTKVSGHLSVWGGGDLKYDVDHHMLYSSSCLGGFWRVKTE